MKKIFNMILALTVIVAASCKKETLTKFDESVSGNSVYFRTPFLSNDIGRNFTFGYSGPAVQDTVLNLAIAVSGKPADRDREFAMVIQEYSTLKQGQNFDFVNPKFIVPANAVVANVRIRFYRSPDIATEKKRLALALVSNENFNVNVTKRVTTNKDTLSLLDFYFIIDDLASAPYAWSVTPYKTDLDNYLGAYSKVKLQLLVELFDIDPVVFTDQQYAKDKYFSVPLLSYWGGYMKLWLAREATAGRIHKDEKGQVITMGVRAQ